MSAVWSQSVINPPTEPESSDLRLLDGRKPESFAQEQIRGLVRGLFCGSGPPIRQVIFTATELETDVQPICRQVAEALAQETLGSIAVVGGHPRLTHGQTTSEEEASKNRNGPLRESATRVQGNLWLVPRNKAIETFATAASLHLFLAGLRCEFDYSILEAPPAGESYAAAAMGQFADGIVLVVSAHNTRRVTARRVKQSLERAQTRLLGTVLCDRVFPIPEAIYRRL